MKYKATQEQTNQFGFKTFFLSPIDNDKRGQRVPATAIDWTETLLENEMKSVLKSTQKTNL